MALRYCAYKDCHNYYNIPERLYSKKNITFFQFPKDPQRRQKWLDLGKAQLNLATACYFYCSEHFDKKYMSERHRRTILVGQAVPYAHESMSEPERAEGVNSEGCVVDELSNEYCVYEEVGDDLDSETIVEQQQDQDLQVESTTMTDEDIIQLVRGRIDLDDNLLHITDNRVNETKTPNKCAYKRKAPSVVSTASSSSSNAKIIRTFTLSQPLNVDNSPTLKKKTIVSLLSPVASGNDDPVADLAVGFVDRRSNEPFIINNPNAISDPEEVPTETVAEEQDIDMESLVDSTHATVFIFKGEEYVQMPKDFYIKEKIDLMKKLQKMENVIDNIKKQLTML